MVDHTELNVEELIDALKDENNVGINWIANRIIVNEEFWQDQYVDFHGLPENLEGLKKMTVLIFVAAPAHETDFQYYSNIGITSLIQWSGIFHKLLIKIILIKKT